MMLRFILILEIHQYGFLVLYPTDHLAHNEKRNTRLVRRDSVFRTGAEPPVASQSTTADEPDPNKLRAALGRDALSLCGWTFWYA